MVREPRDKPTKPKNLLINVTCNSNFKLLIFLLFSFATLFPFLPTRFSCLTPTPSTTTTPASAPATNDNVGAIKRSLIPYGTAAYNFILMSAYRGGASTFAVVGMASKPLHLFSRPTYTCEYQTNTTTTTVPGRKILPDWGYGRVYTTVVINCTFPTSSPASDSTTGGRLLIHAATNGGFDRSLSLTDSFTALVEPPNSWNISHYSPSSPPKYDFLYCGSPLYGNLSPQRVREWVAYHVRLLGKRSHFVIYDAGGVHAEVMQVLRPWMELGFVTVQDVGEEERFDGYYHNQFLVVNDCLHRHRFDAEWILFFDVDEFLHVTAPKSSLASVMNSLKEYTQVTIEQMPMSNQLCLTHRAAKISKKWGFEKLVYRDIKRVVRRDRKYAVQPRNVFATGVHMSQHLLGNSTRHTEKKLRYFHFHGTIAWRREPCRRLLNLTSTTLDGNPYVLDTTLSKMAPLVKSFELQTIGPRLQATRL